MSWRTEKPAAMVTIMSGETLTYSWCANRSDPRLRLACDRHSCGTALKIGPQETWQSDTGDRPYAGCLPHARTRLPCRGLREPTGSLR